MRRAFHVSIERPTRRRDDFLLLDGGALPELAFELDLRITVEDVLPRTQHALNHRVGFRYKLHDTAVRQTDHPVEQHWKRNIPADRDVVLEGQRQYGVGPAAGAQSRALILMPSLARARIAGIHLQRQKIELASERPLHGEAERPVIAVETDDIFGAGAQRGFTIESGVAAEIPDRPRPQAPREIRHKGQFTLLLFRQVGIQGRIVAPGCRRRAKGIAHPRYPASEISQHETKAVPRKLSLRGNGYSRRIFPGGFLQPDRREHLGPDTP